MNGWDRPSARRFLSALAYPLTRRDIAPDPPDGFAAVTAHHEALPAPSDTLLALNARPSPTRLRPRPPASTSPRARRRCVGSLTGRHHEDDRPLRPALHALIAAAFTAGACASTLTP